MKFTKDSLKIDADQMVEQLCKDVRRQIGRTLNKSGAVVGISGGIDSSVCVALAAKALGASKIDIMLRHILPNILTPIIVMATLNCAFAIIMEVALSFLGIGIQPPEPTWGLILSNGWQQMRYATWISTFSGLAITITVLGFNLLGDGLRDLMDPSMRRVMQSE